MSATFTKKFKKGDKIKLINGDGMGADTGATAIVTGYDEEGFGSFAYLNVKWIRENTLCHSQCNGGYSQKSFELVEEIKDWKKRLKR